MSVFPEAMICVLKIAAISIMIALPQSAHSGDVGVCSAVDDIFTENTYEGRVMSFGQDVYPADQYEDNDVNFFCPFETGGRTFILVTRGGWGKPNLYPLLYEYDLTTQTTVLYNEILNGTGDSSFAAGVCATTAIGGVTYAFLGSFTKENWDSDMQYGGWGSYVGNGWILKWERDRLRVIKSFSVYGIRQAKFVRTADEHTYLVLAEYGKGNNPGQVGASAVNSRVFVHNAETEEEFNYHQDLESRGSMSVTYYKRKNGREFLFPTSRQRTWHWTNEQTQIYRYDGTLVPPMWVKQSEDNAITRDANSIFLLDIVHNAHDGFDYIFYESYQGPRVYKWGEGDLDFAQDRIAQSNFQQSCRSLVDVPSHYFAAAFSFVKVCGVDYYICQATSRTASVRKVFTNSGSVDMLTEMRSYSTSTLSSIQMWNVPQVFDVMNSGVLLFVGTMIYPLSTGTTMTIRTTTTTAASTPTGSMHSWTHSSTAMVSTDLPFHFCVCISAVPVATTVGILLLMGAYSSGMTAGAAASYVDVFASACDFATDTLWVLAEDFFNFTVFLCACFSTCFISLLQVLYLTFRKPSCPPVLKLAHACLLSFPADRLAKHRLSQVFRTNETFNKMFINVLASVTIAIWLPVGMVMLCFLGPLVVACLLFVGTMLQITRLMLIPKLCVWYLRLWGHPKDVIDLYIRGESDAILVGWLHRTILGEVLGESVPGIAVNIINTMLVGKPWTAIASMSLGFSIYAALRLGWPYFYWLVLKQRRIGEVPFELGKKDRLPGVASEVVCSVIEQGADKGDATAGVVAATSVVVTSIAIGATVGQRV